MFLYIIKVNYDTMRSDKDIKKLIKRINDNYKENYDQKYLSDIKITLNWALQRLESEPNIKKFEEMCRELCDITTECLADEIDLEYKGVPVVEFMCKEFCTGNFENRKNDLLNVCDALDWLIEGIDTDDFVSDSYLWLDLEDDSE